MAGDKETFDIDARLTKKFKEFVAVDDVAFMVQAGEVFGLLGPNGAGKTTTIKMLTTLLKPTAGGAMVAGHDIIKDQNEVRKKIGIVFQDPSLDDQLTGRENLAFHAMLYHIENKEAKQQIEQVLKLVELEDKADILVMNYSGGMKRRLEIARGLMHKPKILFLDEPTIGLDPQTRRKIWDYIVKLNKEHNTTIILTTHYIEEADFLCNRVAFVDHGKIVAMGTPMKLKSDLDGDIVTLRVNKDVDRSVFSKKEKWILAVDKPEPNTFKLTVQEGEKRIPALVDICEANELVVESVNLHKPSLEDVFIHFTGKGIREEHGDGGRNKMRQMSRGR